MKILLAFIILIFSASCMAHPLEADSLLGDDDCTEITASFQLDECVSKELVSSNSLLANELEKFEQRAKNVYAADQELGKKFINTVRAAQEAWLIFRDRSCKIEAFEVEPETPAYVTTINSCVIRMNSERGEELKYLLR